MASHAEYLLGRVAQLGGEPAEAGVHYEAAVAEYARAKKAAQKRLQGKVGAAERARLEVLVRAAPESVAAASYQAATLDAEAGKYAEALPKFERFAKDFPDSPLTPDAHLRAGICYLQLGRADDAVKQLLPHVEFKRTADQAYLWLGKAQLARARGGNPAALKLALECLEKAVAKADAAGNEADASERRHEARLELADARLYAGEARRAAEDYERLWNGQAFPTRRAELLFRVADAWGRAGDADRSRGRVEEFARTFPDSPLAARVALRGAQNALDYAARAESQKQNRDQVLRLYEEAAAKFGEATEKSPDPGRAAEARYGRAVCLARAGQPDAAAQALSQIPPEARVGELAAANYLLGDCLIRSAPAAGESARDKLSAAAQALETFVAEARPAGVPGALLKLGHARARLAELAPEGDARNQWLDRARDALERLTRDFAADDSAILGRVELARVRAARGDRGGATADLRPFVQDQALRATPAAPLAVLHLATLLRDQNQPQEAAKILLDARQRHEGRLLASPGTAAVAALLKFHQALALSETDKPHDAIPLFDQVMNSARGEAISAEAALRVGQIRLAEAKTKLDAARREREQAPEEKKKQAEDAVERARHPVRQVGEWLARVADQAREQLPAAEARARLYYESAWAYRAVAESLPAKANAEDLKPARASYAQLIEQFPDAPTAADARLELADLLADQGDKDAAVELLNEAAVAGGVAAETAARVRLKLGALLMAAGDFKAAAGQFDAVVKDDKSPRVAPALARAGEAYFRAGDFARAAERLTPFRDDPALRDRDGLGPRSLVRLGQAQLKLKQFDAAKKSFDALIERFGQDALAADARFGLGEILQAKGDHDGAIRAFERVADATVREVAAQARLRIGLSRIAQKKYADAAAGLLAVGYEFADFPAAGRVARLEAARALALDGKARLAREVLTKLVAELPEGELAEAARARLAELK